MNMEERLNGTSSEAPERALVTGATSGIGRAIALRLAQRGAMLGIVGRNKDAAEQVCKAIVDAGGKAQIILGDVGNSDEVARIVKEFVGVQGGIDTVVASAGVAPVGSAVDLKLEDWDLAISVNLSSVFYLAKFAMPELIQTRGTFTIISSDAAFWGDSNFSSYIASKHGVHGLMKSMALDYGKFGVRTNAVCPGFVQTPMADKLLEGKSEEEMAAIKLKTPLGRHALPEDVAEVVAHLSSDAARHANGVEYRLDGGKTAGHYKP